MSDIMKKALADRVSALAPPASLPIERVPENIIEGVRKALLGGETHYTDRPGIEELRVKVGTKLGFAPDGIIITNGAREGAFVTGLAIGETPKDVLIGNFHDLAGISSFRVGFVAAPPDQAKKIRAMKQALSICTAAPSQRAVILALGVEEGS